MQMTERSYLYSRPRFDERILKNESFYQLYDGDFEKEPKLPYFEQRYCLNEKNASYEDFIQVIKRNNMQYVYCFRNKIATEDGKQIHCENKIYSFEINNTLRFNGKLLDEITQTKKSSSIASLKPEKHSVSTTDHQTTTKAAILFYSTFFVVFCAVIIGIVLLLFFYLLYGILYCIK